MTGEAERIREVVDQLYRTTSRSVLATLIRLLGSFELAEEALHDAFVVALERWPTEGVPANPKAWLVSTGRFRAIDGLRRRARFDAAIGPEVARLEPGGSTEMILDDETVEDDQLRLVFTCCHPALAPDAQVALTLREVCGLTTEEIARAFLTQAPTVAQRIVRAKAKIRDAGIPYQVPAPAELPDRLDTVLQVIYLVYNEGYSASSGASVTRADLAAEAIRLARLLLELLPDPEVAGLLGLMLLHESRRAARTTADGDLILLEDQDRARWDRAGIEEGRGLVTKAFAAARVGRFAVQAAIAAEHAAAPSAQATDWARIVALYDLLVEADPSSIVALNRAAAVAFRDGPAAGLALIDTIREAGGLEGYHLVHAARADLLRRLGRLGEAGVEYTIALGLARQEPERRFLAKRLAEIAPPAATPPG
ncbi:MAG: RNA polymerase sigma factor [Gemmatimonadales bacterium]